MPLMKSSNVPDDAVILNETEAIGYTWDCISRWKPLSDVWALRYGPLALGAINSISGLVINQHYRRRLKLGNYGYISSSFPIAFLPGVLTVIFHKHTVSTDIVLMKSNCPICYEMKSTALQLLFGIAYPMVLAPMSALMMANRYATVRIPHINEGPKVMYQFLKKHTKSYTKTLGYMALAQVAASAVVTYFEIRNNLVLQRKTLDIEQKLINQDKI